MRPVLPILLLGFLAACKPDIAPAEVSSAADSLSDSASMEASDSESSTPDLPEDFDRLPIARIDSALSLYNGGDTLSVDSVDNNDCIGLPWNRYRLSNGLKLEGNAYHMYATSWAFEGRFLPVMGLQPGQSRAQVQTLLGRPAQIWPDSLEYLSEKPDGFEKEYFEARWTITIRFEADTVKSLLFQPSFDDC